MDITNKPPQIRVVMLPKDTNAMGNIFGGIILSHIDLAAGEAARGISPHLYVTKVMKEVDFISPVKVGDTVLYGKYSGTELSVDGNDYLIMRESDIFAIL